MNDEMEIRKIINSKLYNYSFIHFQSFFLIDTLISLKPEIFAKLFIYKLNSFTDVLIN